tara:strand:+ start:770 stop:1033 length:264 start_codon:yes stop_codon:yes gene_type:complete
MENQEPNVKHQWTKSVRKKFNLFIKEKNPSFPECKEFIRNLGIDLNEINLRFAAGIYIFEKYDGRHTVEEIKEIIEDETDNLIYKDN